MRIFPTPIQINRRRVFVIIILALSGAALEAVALSDLANYILAISNPDSTIYSDSILLRFSDLLGFKTTSSSSVVNAFLAIIALTLSAGFHLLLGVAISGETERVVRVVRSDLTSSILRGSFEGYRSDARDVHFFIVSTTRQLGSGIQGVLGGLTHGVMMLGFVSGCVIVSPKASVGILFIIVCVFVLIVPVVRLIRKLAKAAERSDERFSSEISALTQVFPEIKIHGLTDHAIFRVSKSIEFSRVQRKRLGQTTFSSSLAYRDVALILFAALLAFLPRIDTSVTAGLASAGILGLRALASAHSVNLGRNARGALRAVCGELEEVQNQRRPRQDFEGPAHGLVRQPVKRSSNPTIVLDGVEFNFEGTGSIFLPVSAEINGPGLVGVLGPSGVGKSTLLEIICGLRRPVSGNVRVNSYDPASISEDLRREMFSVSLQQTTLLPGTLRENLAFLREPPPDPSMIEVLRSLGLWAEFQNTSVTLDSHLGLGGNLLSGGQRQRLGVARAVLSPNPVVLLDEPTSGLDPESIQEVADLLLGVANKSLVVVISHTPELNALFEHKILVQEPAV